MKTQVLDDFLTPGIDQLRTSIRGINDSYNNSWDILAELCQNAVGWSFFCFRKIIQGGNFDQLR